MTSSLSTMKAASNFDQRKLLGSCRLVGLWIGWKRSHGLLLISGSPIPRSRERGIDAEPTLL